MTDDSIEFQPLPDNIQAEVPVRQSFRVPVSDADKVAAILCGRTYAVADISTSGIAVHADSCLDFVAEQVIEDAELLLGTSRLGGLTGKVVHCSVHDNGNLKFGITWIHLPSQTKDTLDAVIGEIKARALRQDDRQHGRHTTEKT